MYISVMNSQMALCGVFVLAHGTSVWFLTYLEIYAELINETANLGIGILPLWLRS